MKPCHPERRSCFAKRSNFGVEGSRDGVRRQCRFKAFSVRLRQQRENALTQIGWFKGIGILRLRETSLRELSLRSG